MRKQNIVKITDNGKELEFSVQAMPATRHYEFTAKALLLLAGSGLETGGNVDIESAARLLQSGGLNLLGKLDYDKARPLLSELLQCCTRIVRDKPGGPVVEQPCTLESVDDFISDSRTIFKLQMEALKVNFDFFDQGLESPSNFPEALNMGRPGRQTA